MRDFDNQKSFYRLVPSDVVEAPPTFIIVLFSNTILREHFLRTLRGILAICGFNDALLLIGMSFSSLFESILSSNDFEVGLYPVSSL